MVQLIGRDGAIVAIAGATRFYLAPEVESRPPEDPERRIVVLMCEYARRVGAETVPGPYTDALAERWARFVLDLIATEPEPV